MRKLNYLILLVTIFLVVSLSAMAETEILRPNAPGDVCTFPTENGNACPNHYLNVDEAVSDDGSTMNRIPGESGNPYYRDLFNLQDSSGSGTINKITVYIRVQQPYYAIYAYIDIKPSDTIYESNQITIPNGRSVGYPYTLYSNTWTTNPDTNGAWTWSEIDNLQAGSYQNAWYYASDNYGEARTTQVYVEVDYTSSPTTTTSTTTTTTTIPGTTTTSTTTTTTTIPGTTTTSTTTTTTIPTGSYDRATLYKLLESGVGDYKEVLKKMENGEFRDLIRLYLITPATSSYVDISGTGIYSGKPYADLIRTLESVFLIRTTTTTIPGTTTTTTTTVPGTTTTTIPTPYITDSFNNEDNIASKENIMVDTGAGQVKLGLLPTVAMYEYYNTGDDSTAFVYERYWVGQTFTTISAHEASSVKLKIYREGSPGTVTVSIRAASGGLPTGGDLCSGSTDGNALNTFAEWHEITFSSNCSLSAGTQYAIVIRASSGNIVDRVLWQGDYNNPTYTGGSRLFGYDFFNQVEWATRISYDQMFEVWGMHNSGTLTSINLLSGQAVASIGSFGYDASSIPSGTSLKVQFSQDGTTNWYDSNGVLGQWDSMSQGQNLIDLSSLGWSGPNFYYKIGFTSDGISTPLLDSISVTAVIIPCTYTGLGTPVINPANFQILCPANSNTHNCLQAYANDNSNECAFSKWSTIVSGNIVNDDPTSDMLSQSGLSHLIATGVVDDNTGTYAWHTFDSSAGAWLKMDLGAGNEKRYTKARIFAVNPNYADNYNIQYSDDGNTWENAATGFIPSNAGWNEKSWNNAGVHRYWRLYLTNTPGVVSSGFMELEMYKEEGWVYGNNAIFDCPEIAGGTYTAKCKSIAGTTENCCANEKTAIYTRTAPFTVTRFTSIRTQRVGSELSKSFPPGTAYMTHMGFNFVNNREVDIGVKVRMIMEGMTMVEGEWVTVSTTTLASTYYYTGYFYQLPQPFTVPALGSMSNIWFDFVPSTGWSGWYLCDISKCCGTDRACLENCECKCRNEVGLPYYKATAEILIDDELVVSTSAEGNMNYAVESKCYSDVDD